MKRLYLLFTFTPCIYHSLLSQNVGIGTAAPTDKLHVDSGHIRLGMGAWINSSNSRFLKIGDGNYITIGEEEADDKLTIRAKELLLRPSASNPGIPVTIQGSGNYSHFYFGTNEDTYIRGGKSTSNLILGDGGGRTGVGVYPQRAGLEQNGAVGVTAALFGGEGAGISLQRSWPAIGFNHWYDGATHRSIAPGWVAQLALNQSDGSLYYSTFNDLIAATINDDMFNATTHFTISRKGNVFIDGNTSVNNTTDGAAIIVRTMPINNTPNNNGIRFQADANIPWNIGVSGNLFRFYSNGTNVSYINSADGSYSSISDLNKKKSVRSLENIFEYINKLNPVSYLIKTESDMDRKHFGFISQEVEKIFPELVTETEGVKMMNYTGLIPILTKGMQEQQQQIQSLQNENTDLKKRLEKLEKIILNGHQ